MTNHVDILKAGGVIIKDRKFLVARAYGKDFFVAPGGKLEAGENTIQALVREMIEETELTIDTSTLESLGSFTAPAAGQENKTIRMDVFIIHDYEGTPSPSNEIEEIKWIDSETTGIKLGSIFEHDIMPILKDRDLIN